MAKRDTRPGGRKGLRAYGLLWAVGGGVFKEEFYDLIESPSTSSEPGARRRYTFQRRLNNLLLIFDRVRCH